LGKLTENCPKSLVMVAGKPFIFHQLDLLAKQGCLRAVLCIGHLGSQIINAVGAMYRGMEIQYSAHPDINASTMDRVRWAAPMFGTEWVTVYGDSYLDTDWSILINAARNCRSKIMQAVWKRTDYGITYFTQHGLQELNDKCTEVGQVLNWEVADDCEMDFKWLQMGDPAGLLEVETYLTKPSFASTYLSEVKQICDQLNRQEIEAVVRELVAVRERGGRLWIIGLGGSAANAAHAANDARKLCSIEAYAPAEATSEWTAHGNDSGWRTPFVEYMKTSNASARDLLMVLSVGGGMTQAPATSVSIAYAVQEANRLGMPVVGVVGRDGGFTRANATATVLF
jgi:D-sedoheptulose 7-phosphate isomerase